MANYTKEQWNAKQVVLMEKCYDCFAEYGLHGTGIWALSKHCGCTSNMLYIYFENLDDLIMKYNPEARWGAVAE
ncbi:MAG: TetR/AcrR family transcriptional regulator [Lachnospiraceae bacterium]